MFILQSFTTNFGGFAKILKVKIYVFKICTLRSKNFVSVTGDHVKSSQIRNGIPLQFKRHFLHAGTGIIFLFLEAKFIHQCF